MTVKYPQLQSRRWLEEQLQQWTTGQIAAMLHCSPSLVEQAKQRYGLRSGVANRFRDRTLCDDGYDLIEARRRREARVCGTVQTPYGVKRLKVLVQGRS